MSMMSIKGRLKEKKDSKLYSLVTDFFYYLQHICFILIYIINRPFSLKNRVVASSFSGRNYGGNPKYVLEQIHSMNPNLELIWIKDNTSSYSVPNYIKAINGFGLTGTFAKYYYYATSKVWIDSHFLYGIARKRHNQFFIETWHGGLGIKKIGMDSEDFRRDRYQVKKMRATVKLVDAFISNSDHISGIYRNAFEYNGDIIKCGYPENDILIKGTSRKKDIYTFYNIPRNNRILLYAPTFRDGYENGKELDLSPYDIDYLALKEALKERFGGNWIILVRWHPVMEKKAALNNNMVINVTSYPDIQDLIAFCDCMISDYSSCIFDAAIRKIPCFTYTSDLVRYEEGRGVYYKVKELPFPNATNNMELGNIIRFFDSRAYLKRWNEFVHKTGLIESGKAAEIVAKLIISKMN